MLGPPSSGLWSAGHNVRGLCSFSPAPLQVTEPPVSPKLARAAASPRPTAGRGEGHLRSRLSPWGHRCPSVSTSLSLMWPEPLSFLLTPVPCLRGWETAPDASLCRIYILGISLFRPTPPRPPPRRGNPCPICRNRNQRAGLSRGQSSLRMRTPKPALAETRLAEIASRLLAARSPHGMDCSAFLFRECSKLWRELRSVGPRLAHVDVHGSAVAFLLQFFMLCRLLPPSRSSFYGGGRVMSSAPRVALGAGHRGVPGAPFPAEASHSAQVGCLLLISSVTSDN